METINSCISLIEGAFSRDDLASAPRATLEKVISNIYEELLEIR